jgi:hypothetical protein
MKHLTILAVTACRSDPYRKWVVWQLPDQIALGHLILIEPSLGISRELPAVKGECEYKHTVTVEIYLNTKFEGMMRICIDLRTITVCTLYLLLSRRLNQQA